jgi:hypothetical protein
MLSSELDPSSLADTDSSSEEESVAVASVPSTDSKLPSLEELVSSAMRSFSLS